MLLFARDRQAPAMAVAKVMAAGAVLAAVVCLSCTRVRT